MLWQPKRASKTPSCCSYKPTSSPNPPRTLCGVLHLIRQLHEDPSTPVTGVSAFPHVRLSSEPISVVTVLFPLQLLAESLNRATSGTKCTCGVQMSSDEPNSSTKLDVLSNLHHARESEYFVIHIIAYPPTRSK